MEKPILTASLSSQSLAHYHTSSEKGESYVHEEEKMNRRRDRHDVVAEILKTARGGKIKTHIMYEVKLNYPQIEEYLPLLIEKRFLENNTIKRKRQTITIYKTTERGMEFLDRLEFVNKLWAY